MAKATSRKTAKEKTTKPKAAKKKAASKKKPSKADKKLSKKAAPRKAKKSLVAETSSNCTPPYCEYECVNGTWLLVRQDFGGSPYYTCMGTMPDPCSSGSFCTSAIYEPPTGTSQPAEKKPNSGEYVLRGGKLWLTRATCDPNHYCPNPITLTQLKKRDTKSWEIVKAVKSRKNFDSVTLSLNAIKK